jgi:hypothetical protein
MISAALRHGKSRDGKGLQLSIFTRRKMRDFLRFDRDKWIPESPLNITAAAKLTARRRIWIP